jgi:hypothetical protein
LANSPRPITFSRVEATQAENFIAVDRAENRHVIDGKFQPGLKKQRLGGFISVCSIFKCNHSLAEVK